MKKENKVEKVNIIDVLLDDNNTSPIIMYNDEGEEVQFDQIAVIPLGEELYCILKPITKVEGIGDDEAVVFEVIEEGEDAFLKVEDNELVAIRVFDAYYELVFASLESDESDDGGEFE